MDLADYEAIGGIDASLDRHLERLYTTRLSPRQRELAEPLFRHLTTITEDGAEIRRPTQLSRICSSTKAAERELAEIVDIFRAPGRSFLMPPPPE